MAAASAGSAGDTEDRERRRRRRLLQELTLRAGVGVLVLVFDHAFAIGGVHGGNAGVRAVALVGIALNLPYYLAARSGRRLRDQAYLRMVVDVILITAGLASGGGLAAASFLGVYVIVPLYTGLVFSSTACLIATALSTVCFLGLALMQHAGWLSRPAVPPFGEWSVAAFNLLILNLVGGMTALLAHAYRRSRRRLAEAHEELARAHEQSLALNAEIQRAAQLRALGEVAAGVTHELGNVLSVAAGHLGLARKCLRDSPAEAEAHLGQVDQSFDSALRIIRTTLQSARQAPAGPTPVDLADLARRVVELKAYEFRREGITARVRFPARFPPVPGVGVQLQQVLLNLVTNAQHALRDAPPPRELDIVGLVGPGGVVLEVADTGPGIPSEILPRVFEPFVTTKRDGTGLGLAICAGIVRELGGEITAENRGERGAAVRIRLPVAGVG
ncbi:MAG TPA: ATP-binding protein [Candidatus Binatia bacterium]|nr:ATP-binding protein [Candidatus Binatia bacterium]